jgi:hypothetical protein
VTGANMGGVPSAGGSTGSETGGALGAGAPGAGGGACGAGSDATFEQSCVACAASACEKCLCTECTDELQHCAKTSGCPEITACIRAAQCTGVDCYCGTFDAVSCAAGQSNGPCKAAILAAPGSRVPTVLNPSAGPASDAAAAISGCMQPGQGCAAACPSG